VTKNGNFSEIMMTDGRQIQTTHSTNKEEGDITLHYIDILAMYCRVLSPSFLLFAVLVV